MERSEGGEREGRGGKGERKEKGEGGGRRRGRGGVCPTNQKIVPALLTIERKDFHTNRSDIACPYLS